MIKRILVVGASVMVLSGCSTLSALGVSQATIDEIQQASTDICGFLPTIETIAAILTGGSALVPSQVADLICKAVVPGSPTAMASKARTVPPGTMVGKVKVEGKFVR